MHSAGLAPRSPAGPTPRAGCCHQRTRRWPRPTGATHCTWALVRAAPVGTASPPGTGHQLPVALGGRDELASGTKFELRPGFCRRCAGAFHAHGATEFPSPSRRFPGVWTSAPALAPAKKFCAPTREQQRTKPQVSVCRRSALHSPSRTGDWPSQWRSINENDLPPSHVGTAQGDVAQQIGGNPHPEGLPR